MNHLKTKLYFPLLFILLFLPTRLWSQAPDPANETLFPLPMSDGTSGQGVFLWTLPTSGVFVASSHSGQIILLRFQKTTPSPTPEPPGPKPDPVPPAPPVQAVSSFIVVSETQEESLQPILMGMLKSSNVSFFAYTVEMVSLEKPPANSLKWIGRTAGKTYPWCFAVSADGSIIWQGAKPQTPADLAKIIGSTTQEKNSDPNCPSGNCPPERSRRR